MLHVDLKLKVLKRARYRFCNVVFLSENTWKAGKEKRKKRKRRGVKEKKL